MRDSQSSDIELCIFILVDGARPDVINQLVDAGEMPNVRRYIAKPGTSGSAVTCLPSTTSVGYLPMLAGLYPGTADVPGIRWVDKKQFGAPGFFHTGHRSYTGAGLAHLNEDMPDEVETVYELCSQSLAFRSEVQRGLPSRQNRNWILCALPYAVGHYTHRVGSIDRWLVRGLCNGIRGPQEEMPRFIFVPLSDVDVRSHGYGPMSRQVLDSYRGIDESIGAIFETLEKRGILDRTLVILSSDHGNTDTRHHLDLSRMVEEAGHRVFEYPMIHRRNCTAAVMVSGNSLANVYLSASSGWEAPLSEDQLKREHGGLLEDIKNRDEVDFIAYRSEGNRVTVASVRGQGILDKDDDAYSYAWDGDDPLDLGLSKSTILVGKALEKTYESSYPDALEQLWYMFQSKRAGDIVVTSKLGFDLRARYEWPEHHSSHGALSRDQMMVPMMSNRPLAGDAPMRTVDIFPTIANSLNLKPKKPHFGRSLI